MVKLMESERTLFEARRSAREGQKSQLQKRIAQLQDEIVGLKAQQVAKARESAIIEKPPLAASRSSSITFNPVSQTLSS